MISSTHDVAERKPSVRLPPLLPGLSAVHMARFIRNPVDFLDEANARHPDAFRFNLLGFDGALNVLTHPDAVKELFAKSGDDVHAGEANRVLKPFLGEHSMLVLDGKPHARQRKLLLPPFHGDRMQAYASAMTQIAHKAVDAWPLGETFTLHRPMQDITLDVILRTVFGLEDGPRFSELAHLLSRGLDTIAWPPMLFPLMQKDLGPWSPWGKFVRMTARASDILIQEIKECRARDRSGRTDILSLLVDARDEAGAPMLDEEIRDELVTMLVAGHETSATALAWALTHIYRDDALLAGLRKEVTGGPEDAKLDVLERIVKETLRLRPVIPMVGRVLQRDQTIGGYTFKQGMPVGASIYLVHRNPRLYPDPNRFLPDRFLSFKPAPWEWFPFGGGMRRCIGAAFSMLEIKLVLAAIVSRVDLELLAPNPKVKRRAITFTPEGGVPARVTRKKANPYTPHGKA